MSKTKKNSNKAMDQHESSNRSILSSQPITLNLVNSSQMNNVNHYNGNANENNSKVGSAKKNKKIDKSQISGPTGFRVVQHVGLTNNNFEVSV